MGRWIRVDVSRHHHPRGMVAGFWGMVAAQAAWEMCKAHDKSGILPAHYWSAEFIARWWQADRERGGVKAIERGMKQAEKAGLIIRLKDGSIQIHDYHQYQTDPRAGRRKQKPQSNNNGTIEARDPGPSGVIPDDPVSSSTGPDHPLDRSDHSRSDHTEDPAPAPDDPNTLESRVWRAYLTRYDERKGTYPGHSVGKWQSHLSNIKIQLAHPGKRNDRNPSDDEMMGLAEKALDRFFELDDKFVNEADHSLGVFVSRLPRIIQEIRGEVRHKRERDEQSSTT